MKYGTQLCRDFFINHEIRTPVKQPGFNGKWIAGVRSVCSLRSIFQESGCCYGAKFPEACWWLMWSGMWFYMIWAYGSPWETPGLGVQRLEIWPSLKPHVFALKIMQVDCPEGHISWYSLFFFSPNIAGNVQFDSGTSPEFSWWVSDYQISIILGMSVVLSIFVMCNPFFLTRLCKSHFREELYTMHILASYILLMKEILHHLRHLCTTRLYVMG